MTVTGQRSLRIGDREIPVILPNRRDPRLHLSAVIISIHVIGITALGFRVSVPQILSAIAAAGLLDAALTYRLQSKLVWPASGILTGSGVGLILRLVGMGSGEFWDWNGWQFFAGVAAISVLSKYLIRLRGAHLFNPSNLGLVVAFLVLGRSSIEPLDFWWAPLDVWMVLAYLIIIAGGLIITGRLRLLEMALAFWVVFAGALGALAASGHCISASWSLAPVCGGSFWWVVVTSPEILIFLFFMITDPRTVPAGRGARVAFAGVLAVLATILIAPQTVEFGAKVALLGSLVILSPIRGLFDHVFPVMAADQIGLSQSTATLARFDWTPLRSFLRGTVVGAAVVALAAVVVLAGLPARQPASGAGLVAGPVEGVEVTVPALPVVDVGADVASLQAEFGAEDARALALTLVENLAIEGEALRTGNGSLLGGADAGRRLEEMQVKVSDAIATGERIVPEYRFDRLGLHVVPSPDGQSSALAFEGSGSLTEIRHDALGDETGRYTSRFAATFVIQQVAGERWLIVDVIVAGSG